MGGVLSQWVQGDFIPSEAHESLNLGLGQDQRVIVTPYSCALAHATAEAFIDVLVLRQVAANRGLALGRSLKKIHLEARVGGQEQWFEATPQDRAFVKASLLASLRPDSTTKLVTPHRDGLSYWLAQRFIRSALPDAFNKAWAPVREELRKIFKEMKHCRAVLVDFKPAHEGPFDVSFTLVSDSSKPEEITELEHAATELEKLLKACPQIKSVAAVAEAANAVSLEQFWTSNHFDAFDDVSMSDGHVRPVNAASPAAAFAMPAPFRNPAAPSTLNFVERLRRAWVILRGRI